MRCKSVQLAYGNLSSIYLCDYGRLASHHRASNSTPRQAEAHMATADTKISVRYDLVYTAHPAHLNLCKTV